MTNLTDYRGIDRYDDRPMDRQEELYETGKEIPQTLDLAIEYGEARKSIVEINGLYAWLFSPSEIEAILKEAMIDKDKLDSFTYIEDDLSDYEYWYKKERVQND